MGGGRVQVANSKFGKIWPREKKKNEQKFS